MAIGIKDALALVNSKATSASNAELARYTHFYKNLENARKKYTVKDLQNLPNPSLNNGKLYYVDSIDEFRYSSGGGWLALSNYTFQALWSFGGNPYGDLGDGTIVDKSSPVQISGGGTNWIQISSGSFGGGGIKADGTLWTWGYNSNGQLGDGSTVSRSSPATTAGGGSTWLRVVGPGAVGYAMGAIKSDGTLWTWGRNNVGQLGDGSITDRSSPGTIAGQGYDWRFVATGGDQYFAAVKSDGTLWTWGTNGSGQLGDGTITNRSSPGTTAGGGTTWKQVSCGFTMIAAVKSDGTLWTWGANAAGSLGDGTVSNKSSPVTTTGGGTNWVQATAGSNFGAGIKSDGTLWTWGRNTYGQLGDFTLTSRRSPFTTSGGGNNWSSVSAGDESCVGLKSDGTMWTWGINSYGQLGDGTTTSRKSPGTIIGELANWSQVHMAQGLYSHVSALRSNSDF